MNEQRWQWFNTGSPVLGNQIHTQSPFMSLGVREDGGVEGGGGGGGEEVGEGRARRISVHLNSDCMGNSLWRGMKIIGNPLEKRSTYGHERVFFFNKSDVYLPNHLN